ncbi:MAG: FGGY-family carbohydrate kinase [Treponema sp.]|nr:FGGY-family carbohydrate kinase [Treponema sp.]
MYSVLNKRFFFCADLGTSSLKAALIDNSGVLHGFARVPYKNKEAISWLDAFFLAAEQLAAAPSSASLVPITALIISGNGPTLVPVKGKDPETSESLRPLYWYDPVPVPETDALSGEGISSFFLPRIRAALEFGPEKLEGVTSFFSPQEWLSWKLGSRPVTVLPHEGYIPYYWNDDQCRRLKAAMEWFPPFVIMGTVTGELTFIKNAARPPLGLLSPGIPIIAGAVDFIMALIGTGTLEPGKACDRTGSSEGVNLCVSSPPVVPSKELRVLPHAIPGLWNLGAVIPKSGILFEQYRTASGQEEKPHSELVKEILSRSSHPGRLVLETIGRSFVKALDDLEGTGNTIREIVLSGSQCATPLWNQHKAAISGRILKIPAIIHAELAGNAALCETVFSGKNIQETSSAMIRIKETYGKNT